MRSDKLYFVVGEASGDLHASNLMQAILDENASTEFRFWGGDRMKKIAPKGLVKHIKELAFMGFWEVLKNIRTISKNLKLCKDDITRFQPDAIVFVDYPGFNLRIAQWAKEKGIKVFYYISPQVWAWKQSRVHKIKKMVDHMYVILPFEKSFYERFDYQVEYVGHPLLDEIVKHNFEDKSEEFKLRNSLDNRPIVAVLPGSRKQEVSIKLPIMIEALSSFSSHQIVIAGAPTLNEDFYKQFKGDTQIIYGETYELLSNADVAVVTSGTATLETALFKVPEVVCYKGSKLSYLIARQLIKVKYISLVNLIMDREIVKELIQADCTPKKIKDEVDRLINDIDYRGEMLKRYDELELILGGGGASKKVAQSLLKNLVEHQE